MTIVDRTALALAGLAVLSMPVYALVRARRPGDPDVARRPATVLLGRWVRDWLMWAIAPFERVLVALRVSPLAFNVLGVVCGAAAGLAYVRGAFGAGGWLVLLGGLADVLDGRLARAQNVVSPAGAFLDSTLDRFAEVFALAGLAAFYAAAPWRVLVVALALGGSLLVSYTRARGEGLGVSYQGGIMARAERLVLLALASLLDGWASPALGGAPGTLVLWAAAAIAAGALGTALHRTVAIARALARREAGR
jgi:CDP-diacylglycerol--glycerol-3-phosphate 3-phosphatidyltransferase